MRSINKVILIGNLTRDPEMRKTQNGQPVSTFGLATNREWMTQDGQKKSLAEFHNIAAWGRLAEICEKFLKKGKLVYVEGYLKTRSWDSATGIRIFKTEIVIYDMIMLDKRPADYTPPAEQEAYRAEGDDYDFDQDMNMGQSDQVTDAPMAEGGDVSISSDTNFDDEIAQMTGERS